MNITKLCTLQWLYSYIMSEKRGLSIYLNHNCWIPHSVAHAERQTLVYWNSQILGYWRDSFFFCVLTNNFMLIYGLTSLLKVSVTWNTNIGDSKNLRLETNISNQYILYCFDIVVFLQCLYCYMLTEKNFYYKLLFYVPFVAVRLKSCNSILTDFL